jgi:7-keto-8-aminopelargonate synthetase-like enzyme
MIPKYTVEYSIQFRSHAPVQHYSTDDPVACEQFIEELLEREFRIVAIKHEGVALERPEFDGLIKNAASMLASRHICAALQTKPEEEQYRFGFAA